MFAFAFITFMLCCWKRSVASRGFLKRAAAAPDSLDMGWKGGASAEMLRVGAEVGDEEEGPPPRLANRGPLPHVSLVDSEWLSCCAVGFRRSRVFSPDPTATGGEGWSDDNENMLDGGLRGRVIVVFIGAAVVSPPLALVIVAANRSCSLCAKPWVSGVTFISCSLANSLLYSFAKLLGCDR